MGGKLSTAGLFFFSKKTGPECTVQDTIQGGLTQLPAELIHRIMQLICTDTDDAVVNQSLLSLRCCSKELAAASDSARATITLHPCHLQASAPYISKLKNLTAVTIRTLLHPRDRRWWPQSAKAHTPVILCRNDLHCLSTTIPNLTSLTLDSGGGIHMQVRDIRSMLLLWRHSLKRLAMLGCTLITPTGLSTHLLSSDIVLELWAPNMPHLEFLNITNSTLTTLDLSGCPQLCELELKCNNVLASLNIAGARTLRRLDSKDSKRLAALDLSGCSSLHTLRLDFCASLASLILAGCTALQYLESSGNVSLEAICFSDCCSLAHLTFEVNTKIEVLDLSHCKCLSTLECSANTALAEINLLQCQELQFLTCIRTQSLTALDLSGCCNMKKLILVGCSSMTGLDCSRLGLLAEVHFSENSLAMRVHVSHCKALMRVFCLENSAMLHLSVSGCQALRLLVCTHNPVLTSLDISGCGCLRALDKSGCRKLREIDLASCPLLVPARHNDVLCVGKADCLGNLNQDKRVLKFLQGVRNSW